MRRHIFLLSVLLLEFQTLSKSLSLRPSYEHKYEKGIQKENVYHSPSFTDITTQTVGLGFKLKATLLKSLIILGLLKLKIFLIVIKSLILLGFKKFLFKVVLKKIIVKLPFILLKAKSYWIKLLLFKFKFLKYFKKGLFGFKAPLAMLFFGVLALKSGILLALALTTLHKTKEFDSLEESYNFDQDPSYYDFNSQDLLNPSFSSLYAVQNFPAFPLQTASDNYHFGYHSRAN